MKRGIPAKKERNTVMDLESLRKEIDQVDTQITDLFVKRMKLCAEVAHYKKSKGLNIVNQGREREILARVSAQAGDELDGYTRILFATLFDLSRSYQSMLITEDSPVTREIDEALANTPKMLPKKAVVACQGVEGGYAQQACDRVFSFADIMYFRTWEGVFSAVQKGMCQYGILPIENSSNDAQVRFPHCPQCEAPCQPQPFGPPRGYAGRHHGDFLPRAGYRAVQRLPQDHAHGHHHRL